MRANKIYWIKALVVAAVVMTSCGPKDNFKNDDIKGKLAEPLEADKVNKIKALPDKEAKDLSASEQDSLGDVVFDFIYNKMDLSKMSKVECHLAAVMSEKEKSKCVSKRAKCLDEMAKVSIPDLKKQVKGTETSVKDFVKNSAYSPKTYLNAFDMLNFGMELLATMECGITEQEMTKATEDAQNKMAAKLGAKEAKEAEELIKKLFDFMGPQGGVEHPNS